MKKVLSVVLAVLMMLSMTSVAFAADEQKPVANVNLIKGTQFAFTEGFEDFPIEGKDLDYLVGAVFTVDEEGGQSFEDFLVDFKLSVGETVQAEFYGKYGTGTEYNQWLKPGDYFNQYDGFMAVTEGSHHLFKEYGVQSMLDVSTVVAIGTFYCALYIDPNSASKPVEVELTLDMYEKPAAGAEPDYEPVVAEDSETTVVVAEQKAPTAVIEMVAGKDFAGKPVFEDFAEECGIEGIDMNYVVGAYIDVQDTGVGYDNYYVDFVLDLAESVNATFFGAYNGTFGSFPWTQAYQGFNTIPAGQTNILSALNYEGSKMTVADASENVDAFYCAFYVDPDTTPAPVSVSLLPAVYEDGKENEIEIVKETPDSIDEAKVALVAPIADVTMVAGKDFIKTDVFDEFDTTGINTDNLVGAKIEFKNTGKGFENYIVDFNLNLSAEVKAKFFGRYEGFELTNKWQTPPTVDDYRTVPAGGVYLLNSDNGFGYNLNVAEVASEVGTFYCALLIDSTDLNEVVNAKLDVVMFEPTEDGSDPAIVTITDENAKNSITACTVNPVADITMIEGKDFYKNANFADFAAAYGAELDMNNVVGAVLSVNNGGQGFDDYLVDFKLNLSETANAKFFGKYYFNDEPIGWTGTQNFTEVKGGDYYLIKEIGSQFVGEDLNLTVAEVVKNVETFYCVLVVEPGTDTDVITAKLDVVMYEEGKDVATDAVPVAVSTGSDNTAEVCKVNPTAKIEMIPGSKFANTPGFESFAADCGLTAEDMDYVVGAHIDIDSMGKGFENDFVDFVLNLDSPVEAMFFGKYTAEFGGETKVYDWTSAGTFSPINAGKTNILSYLGVEDSKFTLAEVKEYVDGGFYCAFYVKPDSVDAPVNVSLVPALYKEDADVRVEADHTEDSVVTEKVALVKPVAGVTMVAGKDFEKYEGLKDFSFKGINPDFVIGAILTVENAGKGFEDYIADFKLNLSADVKAKLYGQYGEYGWICATNGYQAVPAGDYYLLNSTNPLAINMSVAQIAEDVQTFYCAIVIDPDSVKEVVNAQLDVVMYETPEEGAPEFVVVTDEDADNSIEACFKAPVVNVTMIKGADLANTEGFEELDLDSVNLNNIVGAVIELTDKGIGFDDYIVDFKLTPTSTVKAMLFGTYTYGTETFEWSELYSNYVDVTEDGMFVLNAADKISGYQMKIAEIDENVKKLYCAFLVDPATAPDAVNVELDVVMFAKPAAEAAPEYVVITDKSADNTIDIFSRDPYDVEKTHPTVDITMIPGRDFSKNVQFKDFARESEIEDLNMDCVVGAEITLISTGEGFDNSLVDFKLGVSEAVDAMLYGKYYYGDVLFDWTAYSEAPVKIGEDGLYVLGSANNDDFEMKLSEVDEMVGTFYCVLVVDPDTAEDIVNVTLDTVVYDKPEAETAPEYKTVNTTAGSVKSADVCRIRPVVEIEMIDGADFTNPDTPAVFADFAAIPGFEAERVVGAVMSITDMGKFFDDSLVDFRLGLSDDVEAKVYGSYIFNEGKVNEETHAWTSLTGDEYVQFKAGDNYILGTITNSIESLTLTAVNENVGTFYCIFEIEDSSADYEAINTQLDLVLYDKPADGAKVEYIAADCDTNNKSMVLSGWDILVNGVVDAADYEAAVNIALGGEIGYSQKQISSADVDGDGYVDVLDAALVERIVNSK